MARAFIPHVVTEDSALGGSFLERSLRFNDDDGAYLERTPSSAGNRKKWTFSVWIKRSVLGVEQRIFGGNANASHIYFASNDELTWDLANNASGSSQGNLNTEAKFRDPSAWFHLVCALDTDNSTADNRMRMYVNGTEITSFGSRSNPSSGYATNAINDTTLHTIGRRLSSQGSDGMRFDGYMAEINFVDGQAYDPSYFGYTEFQTGIWKPKRYTETYGTNGFYLNFSDNSGTSATTMGRDSSGNGNNFTPNNLAVSDSMIDTPTNNFPMMFSSICSPSLPATISEAGLRVAGPSSHNDRYMRTIGGMPNSGKYYVEVKCVSVGARGTIGMFDAHENQGGQDQNWFSLGNHNGGYSTSWTKVGTNFGTFQTGEYMTIALDMDNGKIWLNRNAAIDTTTQDPRIIDVNTNPDRHYTWYYRETGSPQSTAEFNFGQQSYNFTPPDGFKPLATNNFPTQQTPHVIRPQRHFDTILYTGNGGTSQTISGLEFTPDFVWIKGRNSAWHRLQDSVRGANKLLYSNSNNAEATNEVNGYVSEFTSGGFQLADPDGNGGGVNANGDGYVAWCWKAGGGVSTNTNGNITSSVSVNEEAGFSIVSYTGNGSNGQTVGHGLSQAPKWIILKARDATQNWRVWHHSLASDGSKRLILDQTNPSEDAGFLNDTAPTSTVFTLGNADDAWNANGTKFIAYCWHEVPGFSKFGVYKGNNNSNGPYIHLGFRPAWIMIKNISAGSTAWYILDNKRDPDNPVQQYLAAEDNAAEGTYVFYDFLSNGFKLRNTGGAQNPSNQDVVYMAFADQPGSTAYDTETNAR